MKRPDRPAQLKPFDILLYRNHGLIGALIEFGEKDEPGLSSYSHVAMVYDPESGTAIEQNPPAAHLFALAKVPWHRVDVFRLKLKGKDIFDDKKAIRAAQDRALRFLGPPPEPYDFGFIGKALGLDLLCRMGFKSAASRISHHYNSTKHASVCSTTAEVIAEAGLWAIHPKLSLVPVYLGEGEMKPGDFPESPLAYLVR
jgi:hypothetical protein